MRLYSFIIILVSPLLLAKEPIIVLPILPEAKHIEENAKQRAIKADKEARRAWELGNTKQALKFANEAYEAVPNASTALIRAQILARNEMYKEAFESYLIAYDLDPTDEEKKLIEEGLSATCAKVNPSLGWFKIEVEPSNSTIHLDGAQISSSRTIGLPEGDYNIHVSAEGRNSQEVNITVESCSGGFMRFYLKEQSSDEIRKPEIVFHRQERHKKPQWQWAIIGGGAALLGGGLGLHLWAIDGASIANRYAKPIDSLSDQERKSLYDNASSKAKVRAISAYTLYGIGGFAIITGTVLLLIHHKTTSLSALPIEDGWLFAVSTGF